MVDALSLYLDEGDRQQLTHLLKQQGRLICNLMAQGFIGIESSFAFDLKTPGAQEYMAWLKHTLNPAQPDTILDLYVAYIQEHGTSLRHQLEQDSIIREEFQRELWPALVEIGKQRGQDDFALLLSDPDIWRFLQQPDGKVLLLQYGPAVIPLFFGSQAAPIDLRAEMIQSLLLSDDSMIALISDLGWDTRLKNCILRNDLDSKTRNNVLQSIQMVCGEKTWCAERDRWLKYCDTLSPSALADEVDPSTIINTIPFAAPINKYLTAHIERVPYDIFPLILH